MHVKLRSSVYLLVLLTLAAALYYVAHPRSVICERNPASDDAAGYLENREIYISKDGCALSGWLFFRGTGRPLVVCFGGNASNVSAFLPYAESDKTRSYLLLNYRGYGSSEGKAEEHKMVEDALETVKCYQKKCQTSVVHLLGFSMGTCVATRVAADSSVDVTSLSLLCPFDSMYELAGGEKSGWRHYFFTNRFDVTKDAARVACPVTVCVANDDEVVSRQRTRTQLKHFVPEPVIYNIPATHNGILARKEVFRLIADFWQRCERGR